MTFWLSVHLDSSINQTPFCFLSSLLNPFFPSLFFYFFIYFFRFFFKLSFPSISVWHIPTSFFFFFFFLLFAELHLKHPHQWIQNFHLFYTKNLLFLFYKSNFTKTPHQFIYSTHLFNKIFILLLSFIIFFTVSLSLLDPTTIIITTLIGEPFKIKSTQDQKPIQAETHSIRKPNHHPPNLKPTNQTTRNQWVDQRQFDQASMRWWFDVNRRQWFDVDQMRKTESEVRVIGGDLIKLRVVVVWCCSSCDSQGQSCVEGWG